MAEANNKTTSKAKTETLKMVEPSKETKVNRSFPIHSLSDSLVVSQAIAEMNAGKPMDRILVAKAIGRTPGSSEFKLLLSLILQIWVDRRHREIRPHQFNSGRTEDH